jgi:hypothetical protein
MTGLALVPVLSLLLVQAPGDGWGMAPGKPGEVKHLYWDLFDTTEVWVQLAPDLAKGEGPAPLQLVFQAFYKGREAKGIPSRVGARVVGQAFADLSFRLTYEGKTVDLTGPQGNSRLLFPPACDNCGANGVDAEIGVDVMREYAAATNPGGSALGVPFVLSTADRSALKAFVAGIESSGVTRMRRGRLTSGCSRRTRRKRWSFTADPRCWMDVIVKPA